MATQQKTPQSQQLGLSEPGFRQGLSTFRAQIKKQFIVMKRYPIAFITSFAMVFIILMVFILAATLFTPKGAGDDVGIKSGVIAGKGTLESLFLTPANKFTDLASRISIIIFWTGLNTVLALLLIDYIIADIPFANFETALVVLIFTLLGTFGIGFFMAGLGIGLKESSELLANMLQFFVLILCAMFFPFSVLPEPVLMISRLIPLSYGVDLFR
jgi:ABC-type multidrug transport system permease subunit